MYFLFVKKDIYLSASKVVLLLSELLLLNWIPTSYLCSDAVTLAYTRDVCICMSVSVSVYACMGCSMSVCMYVVCTWQATKKTESESVSGSLV